MGFTYTAKNSILNAMTGRSQYASLAATCMIGVGVMEGDVFTEPDTTTGYSRTLLGNYQSADSKCMGEPVQGNIRNTKIIYLPEAVADWGSSVSIFSSKVKCGDCGSWYGSKVWHSTDKYRRVIWQCNHKFDGEKCTTPTLTEDEMKRLFLQAANIAITEREELISVFESYMAPKLATDALERELAEVETELNVVSGLIDNCIHENARIALNQTAYQEQIAVLEARLNQAEAKKAEVIAEITRRQAKRQEIDQHFQHLRKLNLLTEFRDDDWLAMVDCMTVHRKDEVWVTFKDGSKIKAGL